MSSAEARQHNLFSPVGRAQRYGLLFSIALMAIGLITVAVAGGHGAVHTIPITHLASRLSRLDPPAIADIGILCLLATPLVALLTALVGFLRSRDVIFALVVVLLIAILIVGQIVTNG